MKFYTSPKSHLDFICKWCGAYAEWHQVRWVSQPNFLPHPLQPMDYIPLDTHLTAKTISIPMFDGSVALPPGTGIRSIIMKVIREAQDINLSLDSVELDLSDYRRMDFPLSSTGSHIRYPFQPQPDYQHVVMCFGVRIILYKQRYKLNPNGVYYAMDYG